MSASPMILFSISLLFQIQTLVRTHVSLSFQFSSVTFNVSLTFRVCKCSLHMLIYTFSASTPFCTTTHFDYSYPYLFTNVYINFYRTLYDVLCNSLSFCIQLHIQYFYCLYIFTYNKFYTISESALNYSVVQCVFQAAINFKYFPIKVI